MTDDRRLQALRDLLYLRRPIAESARKIRTFPWDSESELVTLERGDIVRLLKQYQAGRLSPAEVEQWASAIEGRDDIGLESGHVKVIKDFLFAAGTPEFNGVMTASMARAWLRRLG